MSLDTQKIGRCIRQYRKIAGLTQEELAQKVGISTMSVRRYESGHRIAPREIIQVIADVLSVDFYSLVNWDQAPTALKAHSSARVQIDTVLDQMNEAGVKKVADYAEDILPRYRATPFQETGETTPKDAAPASDDSEPPKEDE